jgi:ABC-type lipoprotein export system ATPase subunit
MNAAPPLSVAGLALGGNSVSFDLAAGDILAVLGDNGSGKSLLLAHLSGHLRSPRGAVRVFGTEVHRARKHIGVVFQHQGLIRNMTAYENVALPFLVHGLDLDNTIEAQTELRMQLTGCGHLRNEEVHRLSEGDKQGVALARALSGSTRLLIADEPALALAPAKKALVAELLPCLVQTGVLSAIIVATQDLPFASAIATRFLLLDTHGPTMIDSAEAMGHPRMEAFATFAA